MKVGIDGIPLGGIKTGVGHYTFELAQHLSKLAPQDSFEVVSHLPFLTTDSENSALPSNLQFIERKVSALTRHWWTIGLPLYIREHAIDLFHGTNYDIPVWGGGPTVLTIHDLSLLLYPHTHESRRVRRARRRLPIMSRRASVIITPTQAVKDETCEHLPVQPEKVVVIHEAPRRSFSPLSPQEAIEPRTRLGIEDNFILYVGTIEPRKNLLTLIRAFEEVLEHTTFTPQLVIAGQKGWLTDEFFAYLNQSKARDRILLSGYLGDRDLRALYSTCLTMVYPAIYEGAGLPPLEAMACGAPVITTSTAAITEMVGPGARLVSPMDYQNMARNIVELMSDDQAREALTRAGVKRAGEFTWERAAQLTHEVYDQTLKRHRNQRS